MVENGKRGVLRKETQTNVCQGATFFLFVLLGERKVNKGINFVLGKAN